MNILHFVSSSAIYLSMVPFSFSLPHESYIEDI
nr:MAG TPA: hypothetical protein [Caudoviricetes sp.]